MRGETASRLRSTAENQPPEISHAEFGDYPKEAPNPELKVEKSAGGTSQITHSWAVDKQVKVAGAADSTYADNKVLFSTWRTAAAAP